MSDSRIRVALVFGGRGEEHEISCRSASSILAHLDPQYYNVTAIRIGLDGRWGMTKPPALGRPPIAVPKEGALHDDGLTGVNAGLALLQETDVVFPVLRRPYGGIGTLQDVLDHADIPYVGNGALASAVGMDEGCAKELLVAAGLRVTDGSVPRPGQPEYSREIHVGVLELPDGTLRVSPSLEVKPGEAAPNFEIPARLSELAAVRLREVARRAFTALDCSGLLRVTCLVGEDGGPLIDKVDTVPPLIAGSHYQQMWWKAGLVFEDLLGTLIETALRRSRRSVALSA